MRESNKRFYGETSMPGLRPSFSAKYLPRKNILAMFAECKYGKMQKSANTRCCIVRDVYSNGISIEIQPS